MRLRVLIVGGMLLCRMTVLHHRGGQSVGRMAWLLRRKRYVNTVASYFKISE